MIEFPDEWDEGTRTIAELAIDVGERWNKLLAEKRELSVERTKLIVALKSNGVKHAKIAELFGTSTGAIDQVLAVARREAS